MKQIYLTLTLFCCALMLQAQNATHLHFDGIDDHVEFSNESTFDFTDQMTIEFWVKIDNMPNNLDILFFKDQSWYLDFDSNAHIGLVLYLSGGIRSTNSVDPITLNQWHHFAAVYNGTNISLYIDGQSSGVFNASGNINNSNNNLFAGALPFNQNFNFEGALDEVRIWNIARTATQIGNNMHCELQGNETGMVSYYKFNQGNGASNNSTETTLIDATTNNSNGTLNNFTLDGNSSNWIGGETILTKPIAESPVVYQVGDTAIPLTATSGGDGLLWYTSAAGGAGVAAAPIPDTSSAGAMSYWVSSSSNTCESERIEIIIYVNEVIQENYLSFDGVNDHVVLPNESTFDFTNQMTVEFWMRSSTMPDQWDGLVTKGDDSWRIALSSAGTVAFAANGTFGGDIFSNTVVTDGNWHHVVSTYDGTYVSLYVDGILDNQIAASGNINNSIYAVCIGENLQQTGRFFNGDIDNVRIWNTARSASEIATTASNLECIDLTNANLLVNYSINDDSGNTLTDSAVGNSTQNGSVLGPTYVNGGVETPEIPMPNGLTNQIYVGNDKTLADLQVTGSTITWYDSATGGNNLPLSTSLADNTTYYASNTSACGENKVRLAVAVKQIRSDDTANFNYGSTIADLAITETFGATAEWYTLPSAGLLLEDCSLLNDGIYYVSQTIGASNVSSYSGGNAGYVDGSISSAEYNSPYKVAIDFSGNLYIAESNYHRIRKIDTSGNVTTFAGTGVAGYADGSAATAQFNYPHGITVDQMGNIIVADRNNRRIRKIDGSGNVTTIAGDGVPGYLDGPALSARFILPTGVAVDNSGNIFVVDKNNHRVRKIDASGTVSTVAGIGVSGYVDGASNVVRFNSPSSIVIDASDNLYITDTNNHNIRKIDPSGNVTTFAGSGIQMLQDGQSITASFKYPQDLTIDNLGNLFVADSGNQSIRKINSTGYVTTIAGTGSYGELDGVASIAQFFSPFGIAVDNSGNLYVADTGNNKIRFIDVVNPSNRAAIIVNVNTLGPPTTSLKTQIFVGDDKTLEDLQVTGTGIKWYDLATDGSELPLSTSLVDGASYFSTKTENSEESITRLKVTVKRVSDETQNLSDGSTISDLVITPNEGSITNWYNDASGGTSLAENTTISDGTYFFEQTTRTLVEPLAGNGSAGYGEGIGTSAFFNTPTDLVVDPLGNIYITDAGNNRIRKLAVDGTVTTLSGYGSAGFLDGSASIARFNSPQGMTIDELGNIYIADTANHRIRKIDACGNVITIAGSGILGYVDGPANSARFTYPYDVAVDNSGNVFVADRYNHSIRKIDVSGNVSTIAGDGTSGYVDAQGVSARFNAPAGLTIDQSGNLYVADTDNRRIRKIDATGVVTTIAGSGAQGLNDDQGIAASFVAPIHLTIDKMDNLYISENLAQRLRKIDALGNVTTMAGYFNASQTGNPNPVIFGRPSGVFVSQSGNLLISNTNQHRILNIDLAQTSNRVPVNVSMNTLSVDDFNVDSLKIYPNPSSGLFNIQIKEELDFEIYDIVGKQIFKQKMAVGTSLIDLSRYTTGIYLLRVYNSDLKIKTFKLFKN